MFCFYFFFNDTATTEIYTLSLHDALPISAAASLSSPQIRSIGLCSWAVYFGSHSSSKRACSGRASHCRTTLALWVATDRKSTRLNSSHANISYAVFCLKKKKNKIKQTLHK